METVASSAVSGTKEEVQADSLLDHPTSGLVILAGLVGGLVVFGTSVLGVMVP
ncbi:hypothetical protein Br6_01589 [Rhodococcus sp. Br-6]|jgi:hypothetical protein|nr:hypothetical protein REA19_11000 [Prescottella equi]GBF14221.1 hypothetical protein Br6_01589 [Rhodococcus sp. Br-6]